MNAKLLVVLFFGLVLSGCSQTAPSGTPVSVSGEGHFTVIVKLDPDPPYTLKPIHVTVDIFDSSHQEIKNADVALDFNMPGMTMAENRPQVTHQSDGSYTAEAVLPMSGNWLLTIVVNDGTNLETYQFPFSTK